MNNETKLFDRLSEGVYVRCSRAAVTQYVEKEEIRNGWYEATLELHSAALKYLQVHQDVDFAIRMAARDAWLRQAMNIANLTQHTATPEQVAEGVADVPFAARLIKLLTFSSAPLPGEMRARAAEIVALTMDGGYDRVMLGGAPFFMPPLQEACLAAGLEVVYAFSIRESADQIQPDGSTRKISEFRHVDFVRGERA